MKVLHYPHPILSYVAKPIMKIDQKLVDIVREMFEILYKEEGVGLAGNQVGLPWRFFVMNPTGDPEKKNEEFVFINPIIKKRKGQIEDNEGCLSFPELRLQIRRAESITFQAITLEGKLVTYNWKGFPARIVQHEYDHLNGLCFYECAGSSGQLKAKSILESLQIIYDSDEENHRIPDKETVFKEIKRLEEERT